MPSPPAKNVGDIATTFEGIQFILKTKSGYLQMKICIRSTIFTYVTLAVPIEISSGVSLAINTENSTFIHNHFDTVNKKMNSSLLVSVLFLA